MVKKFTFEHGDSTIVIKLNTKYSEQIYEDSKNSGIKNGAFESKEIIEYITTAKYRKKNDDELSFDVGVLVELIDENDNGYWKVKYNDKIGLVPSTFLKSYDDPMKSIGKKMRIGKIRIGNTTVF